jgi:glycosyltransferase involved in cell wall biosynthesis
MMDLSVVVPLYNEQDSVAPLYESIKSSVTNITDKHEILFVDDGSTDGTFAIAESLAGSDPKLRVVKFRRNYGQTPAMAAGIDEARGRIVVTMDGDLQNDPRDISNFLSKMEEGYDIVVGWRINRRDKLISRKIPSKIANWIIGKVTGVPIRDNGCSLKAFRADVIKRVPLYSEMHRFIPAMASIAGPRIAEIQVRHHARKYGESKYGLSRVYKVLFDLLTIKTLTGFSERPLQWFAALSAPFIILSVLLLGWVTWDILTGGQGSLPIAGTGVFFGILWIFLLFGGALGEIIIRTGDLDINSIRQQTAVEIVHDANGKSK